MKRRDITISLFLVIAAVCTFLSTGFFTTEDLPNEYDRTIEQLEYQLGYPQIYDTSILLSETETVASETEPSIHTVYLTFDDGPSARTEEILDILKEYNIKATFFVIYNDRDSAKETLKRAYDEGHTIGVHSASHSYKEIYKDVNSYIADFEICYNYITDITGETPSIFRFPGGSINSYNKAVYKDIIIEMERRGFTYFDWNVSSDDATKDSSEDKIFSKVVNGCTGRSSSVVLMHDSAPKKDTVSALKRIIPYLLEQGYVFDKLNENVKPTVFRID